MKKLITVIFIALVGVEVIAQITITKGPFDTSMKVAWDMPSGMTLADATTFNAILKDSVNNYLLTLTNVTCIVPSGTATVSCTSPLTSGLVTQLNIAGTHSLTLTIRNIEAGESQASIPFTLVGSSPPPAAPTNFKIIK